MTKTLIIDGMMCSHCAGRIEKALNGIDGVQAKVELDKKRALVELSKDISDSVFAEVITKAGYQLKEIL